MNRAIPNLMRVGGFTIEDALRAATANPARLVGLPERDDRVVFTLANPLRIEAVFLDGEKIGTPLPRDNCFRHSSGGIMKASLKQVQARERCRKRQRDNRFRTKRQGVN